MDRPETINLFRMAHDEVVTLRRKVAALEPRAHAYDTIAILARQAEVRTESGYSVDVAWKLESAVNELTAEREAEKLADQPTESTEA